MSDPSLDDLDEGGRAALTIGAGGVLALGLGLALGSRLLRVAGLAAALAGGGLYARDRLAARQERVEAAKTTIRSELDQLDPVARAQVLADLSRPDPGGQA